MRGVTAIAIIPTDSDHADWDTSRLPALRGRAYPVCRWSSPTARGTSRTGVV